MLRPGLGVFDEALLLVVLRTDVLSCWGVTRCVGEVALLVHSDNQIGHNNLQIQIATQIQI